MTELLIRNIRLSLAERDRDPREVAARALGIKPAAIAAARVVRRSVDARKGHAGFVVSLEAQVAAPPHPLPPNVVLAVPPAALPAPPAVRAAGEVVIVGAGPAGLFAALRLTEAGLRPLLLDRGGGFPERHQRIAELLAKGTLDRECNFHFGLGGAGTYSDGKLFTRADHPQVRLVLEVLARYGAGSADDLLVESHPHVGTDRWPTFLTHFRQTLEERGCRFRFGARVRGIQVSNGRLAALELPDGALPCQAALLAPGNSARDLFETLHAQGIALEAKAFAVGVRLTHPQALIDRIQYGQATGHPALPPATYRLAAQAAGRGVFSFCMCPGGVVIPTPTEPERLSTNGMSNSARDSGEANAALVVTVAPADLGPGGDPLAGIGFQRALEQAAYQAGGGGYRAPAQDLPSFLRGERPAGVPQNGYRPGTRPADVGALLPEFLAGPLRQGLARFCRSLRGFADPQATVIGLETRTSSPVRIVRGKDGMCPGVGGLFPAGEGSGYAGGITTSAVDGLRAADALIGWLRENP